MALTTLLANFHAAILENNPAPAIDAIKTNPRIAVAEQMAIYIDGYRIRLIQAIRSDYPALLALLGDSEFDRLALEYIENNPPISFNLDRYPHKFANFLQSRTDNFAAEIAILEGSIAEVFMMEESAPLSVEALFTVTPEEFGNIILKPRTSSRLLKFSYNVNDWLNAMREENIKEKPQPELSFIYIYRHNNAVQRHVLDEAAYILLTKIFEGIKLETALESAVEEYPHHEETIAFNLQEWFQKWTLAGFFKNI